jgi:hypothetical protein
MRRRLSHHVLAVSLACFAAPAHGQVAVSLPPHADLVDGHHSVSLPFGQAGFRTQILVDTSSFTPNGGVLTAIRFRTDRTSLPLGPLQVPNVTVTVSQSSQVIGGMSETFAANISQTPVTVFQGVVVLPGQTAAHAGPLPWDVVISFQQAFSFQANAGRLLIDIVGNNPVAGGRNYWIDAVEAGGSVTEFGLRGTSHNGDSPNLVVSTNNVLMPRFLTIGQTIDFTTTMAFSRPPGVLLIATDPEPLPIDLGPFGAPANWLSIQPVAAVAHSWSPSPIGWFATFPLTVPLSAGLIDARLYAQSAIFEPRTNALGLVLSAAVELRVGGPNDALPMQQVDADDPAALAGTRLDFGDSTSPAPGAVALRLEGVFF